MSTYYNVQLVIGVSLKDLFTRTKKQVEYTRSNTHTGTPEKRYTVANVFSFRGTELTEPISYYVSKKFLEEGDEKCELQRVVEQAFPGLEYVFDELYPDEGVLGVPIGEEKALGGNVYCPSVISKGEIDTAFELVKSVIPKNMTPTLQSLMFVG